MLIPHFPRTTLAVALAALGLAFNASGATSTSPSMHENTTNASATGSAAAKNSHALSADDRHFATKAAEAGMAEVDLGKLAEQKAQNADVRNFGARMVEDHSKANDRLKQIVATKDMTLPARLDSSGQKTLDKLTKLSGEKFDHAYISKQVSDHKKVIKEFQKEAKSGNDKDLRAFASNTLPTLEEHLRLAQSAEKSVSEQASKSASASPGLKAARKATGASTVTAERQEHMPVAKTGM